MVNTETLISILTVNNKNNFQRGKKVFNLNEKQKN